MNKLFHWERGVLSPFPSYDKSTSAYQPLLDTNSFDDLENLLMESFESRANEIEFYLPAYRFLYKRQESERLLALLQLHRDCLRPTDTEVDPEIHLLQAVLVFWPECGPVRAMIVSYLNQLYGKCPHYNTFIKQCGVEQTPGLAALKQLESCLRYDTGQVVYMPIKGVGRVMEINTHFGTARIQFESGEQLSLRIDEAERLAQSLPKDHFLSRRVSSPEEFRQLAEHNPGELLRLVFTSVKKDLALVELRDMLTGVISDEHWTDWWGRARRDNRLVVEPGAKPTIRWNSSAAEAVSAISEQFDQATALEKIVLLKKHAGRSTDLAARMQAALIDEADRLRVDQPSVALEITLELERVQSTGALHPACTPAELLNDTNAVEIIAGVSDRIARRKALVLIAAVRTDWPDLYARLLQSEADTQNIALLYEALRNSEHADLATRIVQQTITDPPSAPRLFLWLCREMPERKEIAEYTDYSFLLSLFRTLENKAFKGLHSGLRALFDLGGAADRAIVNLELRQAGRMLDLLDRDTALEQYRKERVVEEIFQRFPELHANKKVD
jgi:transcription elongation factor GreA-like protein